MYPYTERLFSLTRYLYKAHLIYCRQFGILFECFSWKRNAEFKRQCIWRSTTTTPSSCFCSNSLMHRNEDDIHNEDFQQHLHNKITTVKDKHFNSQGKTNCVLKLKQMFATWLNTTSGNRMCFKVKVNFGYSA